MGRWTPRNVLVVAPSGAEVRVAARELEPDPGDESVAVPILFSGTLLLLGVFFPPLLMLNIPLLLARSAVSAWNASTYERLDLDAFACPACGAPVPAAQHVGTLPLPIGCPACAARLDVRPAPRVNLALVAPDPAPPGPPPG